MNAETTPSSGAFRKNLVSNISIKFDAQLTTFLVQIRCRFNVHFSWVILLDKQSQLYNPNLQAQ